MKEFEWLFDGRQHLLNRKHYPGQRVLFASFPRTGTNFLRSQIEKLTGIGMGSDIPLHVSVTFQFAGMTAQGVCDDRSWMVNTHWPMSNQKFQSYTCNKIYLLTRNPMDSLVSMFHMMNFNSHHLVSTDSDFHINHAKAWQALVDWAFP